MHYKVYNQLKLQKGYFVMKNTGDIIKQRRKDLGMSVSELARRIGKDRATIYRYEDGSIENMPMNILEPLAKALETTPADLLGWKSNLTDDNAELSVRMLQRTDIIDIVKILMNHDTTFASEVRRYIEFLEIKAK